MGGDIMNGQRYYIEKTSDTSADTLLAVGFASLLKEVLRQNGKPAKGIMIQDAGPYYQVQTPIPITDNDFQNLKPFAIIKPLVTDKYIDKQTKQGLRLDGFEYQQQQEISKSYYEKLRKLPPEYRTPEARANKSAYPLFADIQEPDSQLGRYQTIQQMKIASSFNELAQRWFYLEYLQREHIHILLELFSSPTNDIDNAVVACTKLAKEHGLKKDAYVTALQIINPTTGKGANYAKASELTRAIGNQDSFWPLELLKFVGFMYAAAPYVVKGSKDRKTYVLQPKTIDLNTLQRMMDKFRAVCWSTTVIKLDIMASLRFAQTFIQHRQQALKGETEDDFFGEEQVYSIAHGFEVAFYKDMGSAYATMNVSSINLPYWLPRIKTLEEAEAAFAIVKEHLQIIQRLRNSKGEEGSEEFELLRFYRDFLSGRDLRPFWKFTTAYSSYLISQHEHEKNPQRQIRPFTTTGLENIIEMNTTATQNKLTDITRNEGFRRIAYAIRQSTITAQYRRAQLGDRTYEVRYGLGQELMREVRYRDKFMVALSEFLQRYNAETAREEEKAANKLGRKLTPENRRAYNLRASIPYTDIDEVAGLIDRFKSSELIGSMLVAYGYAREPFKGTTEEPVSNNTDNAELSSEDLESDNED
jgi:hypothetical protein